MPEASNVFAQWANMALVWIGFGTLVGLLAKAIMPGRDPGGAFATVVIGILGSVIGAGVLAFFSANLRVSPLSPAGFVVAILGTSVLLIAYRLLQGRGSRFGFPGLRWLRQRRISVVEEN